MNNKSDYRQFIRVRFHINFKRVKKSNRKMKIFVYYAVIIAILVVFVSAQGSQQPTTEAADKCDCSCPPKRSIPNNNVCFCPMCKATN